jgi:hypothetical protein
MASTRFTRRVGSGALAQGAPFNKHGKANCTNWARSCHGSWPFLYLPQMAITAACGKLEPLACAYSYRGGGFEPTPTSEMDQPF